MDIRISSACVRWFILSGQAVMSATSGTKLLLEPSLDRIIWKFLVCSQPRVHDLEFKWPEPREMWSRKVW